MQSASSPGGSGRSEQITTIVNEESREEASKLLELISLDYKLDGVERAASTISASMYHSSSQKWIKFVLWLALSCIWEMQTVVVADAHEARMTDGLQGFLGLPMAGAAGRGIGKKRCRGGNDLSRRHDS